MTFRDLERAKAKRDAEREENNTNGYHREQSPASTRAVAETAQSQLPEPLNDIAPRVHAAGTSSVQYGGRVRDRMENQDRPAPVQQKPETLYENEVRHFGKYWADIYAAQRARGENS